VLCKSDLVGYSLRIDFKGESMSNNRIVWSSEEGDVRKKKKSKKNGQKEEAFVNEKVLELKLRRLTSGKGRTVIEVTALPLSKLWCQTLAKNLKKSLGVGGTYKKGTIEIHGEKMEQVQTFLDQKSIRWKKTGG